MTGVQVKTVTADEDGLRLDRWFKKQFPGLPFGRLSKFLRTGQVRVNGKRAKGNVRVSAGDEIRIPPFEIKERPKRPSPLKREEKSEIERLVIYRDPDFMVLNKPSGLAVQGGSKTKDHVDRLLPGLQGRGDESPPRLVHRIDKDTSGLLLVARSAKAARFFADAFAKKQVKKVYWALVKGVPKPRAGHISAPLAKSIGARELMEITDKGKPSETLYEVIDNAGQEVSWVALSPLTGRTHQLRVHLAHMGHPILGDGKYGDRETQFEGIEGRLHLHAAALEFPLPGGGRTRITAKLPDHMAASFEFFGFNPKDSRNPFEGLFDEQH